jgi:hypothetical protein
VGGSVLDGPVLHARGDDIGHLGIERLPVFNGLHQAAVDLLGEALAHDAGGEDIGTEETVQAGGNLWGGGTGGGHGRS